MRGWMLFVAGILVGLGVQTAIAQNQNVGIVGLNHVRINVPDLDEAVAYYTETMGFPEAFRNLDDKGQPTLVYVQISENTFVELQPANGRPTASVISASTWRTWVPPRRCSDSGAPAWQRRATAAAPRPS